MNHPPWTSKICSKKQHHFELEAPWTRRIYPSISTKKNFKRDIKKSSLHSLKLTISHLKMYVWNTFSFPFGYFCLFLRCRLLLVLGRVLRCHKGQLVVPLSVTPLFKGLPIGGTLGSGYIQPSPECHNTKILYPRHWSPSQLRIANVPSVPPWRWQCQCWPCSRPCGLVHAPNGLSWPVDFHGNGIFTYIWYHLVVFLW